MRHLISLYFLLLYHILIAQSNYSVDSLKIKLKQEKNPEKKIHLRNLIGEYGGIERISYWDSILSDAQKINYDFGIVYASFMQSLNYTKKGSYERAIQLAEITLKKAKKLQDDVWMGYTYEHLASLNANINENNISLKYFKDALTLIRKNKNYREGHILVRIGEIYEKQNKSKPVLDKYNEALRFFYKVKDTSGISIAYNHIGEYYRNKKDYDSAQFYFQKSLDVRKGFTDQYYLCYTLNNLADIYIKLGKAKLAFAYIRDSEIEAKRIGDSSIVLMQIFDLYYQYYKIIKNYGKALYYKELTEKIEKSINSAENQKAALRQQAKNFYEKQKEIDDIENSKKIAIEKEAKQRQRIILYAVVFGLILVLIFSILIYRRFQISQKQKNIIEFQKNEVETAHNHLEEKNREILDSITYAKRIQSAILPQAKIIKEFLPDSFILYKPKDIVAGDFYWLEVVGDTVLFAAADCTGHGVPGAMVSVVCNNGLNRAVREFGLTKPNEILDKTRELVIQEFEKSDEDVKDGMDISLCALNTTNNLLSWSGAHNPLWIFRKIDLDQIEVLETKADKQPIGKFSEAKPFTVHQLQLQKQDVIYIFTDGFQDQFGGPKEKKFRVAQMRELFLSLTNKSMEEQRKIIEDTFHAWKGELEQVDDVCVIGVKI